jgi:hypothetical protein
VCVLYGLSCSVFLLIIFLAVSSAVLAGMQLVFFLPIFQSSDHFPFYQSERNLPFACAVVLNNQTRHRQSGHSLPIHVWSSRTAALRNAANVAQRLEKDCKAEGRQAGRQAGYNPLCNALDALHWCTA